MRFAVIPSETRDLLFLFACNKSRFLGTRAAQDPRNDKDCAVSCAN
jgi:hypothetical protein